MNGVEIEPKNEKSAMLWKKKDGSLVNINSLSNAELIEARKISKSLADKHYNLAERAKFEVKKNTDISELHCNLLENLDKELVSRKQKVKQDAEILEKALQEI